MEERKIEETPYGIEDLKKECKSIFKNTHLGFVQQIVKAEDYDTTKHRLFVLSWKDALVFMNEADAPDEIQVLKKASDIVGRPIPFKAKFYNRKTKQVFVSFKEIGDMYLRFKEHSTMLKGTVSKVSEEELKIDCMGDVLTMPNEEFFYFKKYMGQGLLGNTMYFNVKEVTSDEIIVSRIKILEAEREIIIKDLESGKVVQAIVSEIKPWGVRLIYNGHILLMRNKDFSLDFTKTNKVYKVGDKVDVKLTEVSYAKIIFVEPVEKYVANKNIDVTKYEKEDVVLGEVVTVATMGIFVNIEPGIDVLCPIPNPLYSREPLVGESVMVRISKVNPAENRIRGKILSIVRDVATAEEIEEFSAEESESK